MSAAKNPPTPLPPWEDRWNEPTIDALVAQLNEQQRRVFGMLLDMFDSFEGIEQQLVWHGDAWKWTIQYNLPEHNPDAEDVLAYLVPDPEGMVLCYPLPQETIDRLPLRRLNRFVREGIRAAKRAVHQHWCLFKPTAMVEVDHLRDLTKRLHKFATNDK